MYIYLYNFFGIYVCVYIFFWFGEHACDYARLLAVLSLAAYVLTIHLLTTPNLCMHAHRACRSTDAES